MSDPLDGSATAMAAALRERRVSAAELLDAHLARIEARNPEINAIVLPRFDAARAEARAADAALARGDEIGPLHGVPFTVKDPIPVAGMRSPNGSLLLADHEPGYDAAPVTAMRRAGAILLGKTNVSEFAAHWDSNNRLFGGTRNPHDPERSAGGSSGGEAAAVATGMSALGVGSDLGGSIRIPAAFVGVFGLRPGRGVVGYAPHHPLPDSPLGRMFGVVGPLARYAEDIELAIAALATGALRPPTAVDRVAVFEEDGLQPVSRACREAVRRAAAALADAGVRAVPDAPPDPGPARQVFDQIMVAESVGLPSFVAGREDQLTRGSASFVEMVTRHAPERTLAGNVDLWRRHGELERAAHAWFAEHPVALCPVVPDVAAPLGGTIDTVDGEPVTPGGLMTLATYANVFGLPALAVPVMRSPEGLPVGIQLIGAPGAERTLIAVARLLEQALGGWIAPPPG